MLKKTDDTIACEMWWLPPLNVATPNLISYLASPALSREFHLLANSLETSWKVWCRRVGLNY
jgi:hypothetical protein